MTSSNNQKRASEEVTERILHRRQFIRRLSVATGVPAGLLTATQVASASQSCPVVFWCDTFDCSNPFWCGGSFECRVLHAC